MTRSLLAALTAAVLVFGFGAPAVLATPEKKAETLTEVRHYVVEVFEDVVPCLGDDVYTITTMNRILAEHTTFHPTSGIGSGSFVEVGTFVAIPRDNASLPTYTGRFTGHFGGDNRHLEEGTSRERGTITIMGTGSDGSTFHFREVIHAVGDEATGELLSGFDKVLCK